MQLIHLKKPHYSMAFALAKFHTCFCIQWFYSQIFIKKNIPLILTTTRKLIKLYSNAFSFKIHLINKATVPSICKNIQERFIKSHIEQNQIIQIIKWQHWRFYFYKTKSFWNSFNFISGSFGYVSCQWILSTFCSKSIQVFSTNILPP